jgi:hypothetical protein
MLDSPDTCPLSGIQYPHTSEILMSPLPDDLASLKDDMIAFIEGHGLRRF